MQRLSSTTLCFILAIFVASVSLVLIAAAWLLATPFLNLPPLVVHLTAHW